ncbi:MAG: STAS domain-containing protein [Gaiellales bacterium]
MKLQLKVERRSSRVTIRLHGALVEETCDVPAEAIERELATGARKICLDLSGVTEVDDAGHACLGKAAWACHARAVSLKIIPRRVLSGVIGGELRTVAAARRRPYPTTATD